MGLDTVELIYKIEKHFQISIPDQEAEKMVTIRNISDFISRLLNAGLEEQAQVEQEILHIVSEHSGVDIKDLWLDMLIADDLGLD
ncbi:MAG TPA: hypothetical protein VGC29_11225 [Flavisolibacter sp.]